MKSPQINPKNLQEKCRRKNLTVAALARKIRRSRQAVYFSAENPNRYPQTYALMIEVLL